MLLSMMDVIRTMKMDEEEDRCANKKRKMGGGTVNTPSMFCDLARMFCRIECLCLCVNDNKCSCLPHSIWLSERGCRCSCLGRWKWTRHLGMYHVYECPPVALGI
jgi:hypothetical protein